MIDRLNVRERAVAEQVLAVQVPAYQIEAALIGFANIPPLQDTAETLQACEETFYGCFREQRLAGVMAFEWVEEAGKTVLDITRMVVHPDFFRQGIAKALMQHAQDLAQNAHPPARALTVATGAKNEPAVQLYIRSGFEKVVTREVEPDLLIHFFRKTL